MALSTPLLQELEQDLVSQILRQLRGAMSAAVFDQPKSRSLKLLIEERICVRFHRPLLLASTVRPSPPRSGRLRGAGPTRNRMAAVLRLDEPEKGCCNDILKTFHTESSGERFGPLES